MINVESVEVNQLLARFLDKKSFESDSSKVGACAVSDFIKNELHILQRATVSRAVGSVRSSVRSVSSAVTSVPSHLVNKVDFMFDGLTKAITVRLLRQTWTIGLSKYPFCLQGKPVNPTALGAKCDLDYPVFGAGSGAAATAATDNIPLRIALLFMDEVFDLRDKNQWLRRQIVAMLRQILKAMFGDWANRRIVDYFSQLTAPATLASYLRTFKDAMWPNGFPAKHHPVRDESTKMRTRVAAKMTLLNGLSDDLKRIIGSETSRNGILMLFDMLQHPVLNKRLAIVLLEAILDTIFMGQDFPTIFARLHSRSPRVRNELKISQRKTFDLRR